MKPKRFKKQKDLIKQAVKKTIYRQDVEKPKRIAAIREKIDTKLKERNWLGWAERKLRG